MAGDSNKKLPPLAAVFVATLVAIPASTKIVQQFFDSKANSLAYRQAKS
jgi:hypothetical protein